MVRGIYLCRMSVLSKSPLIGFGFRKYAPDHERAGYSVFKSNVQKDRGFDRLVPKPQT